MANMEEIVSLAKRRGFVYQGSEIYGGLAGTYDYGPLGTLLKRNITNEWLKYFVDGWSDMYQIDSAILMNPKVWQASGHVDTFTDPLVDCTKCHTRHRFDHVLWANHILEDAINYNEMDTSKWGELLSKIKCPHCGESGSFGEPRQFNLMFQTTIGPVSDLSIHAIEGKDGNQASNDNVVYLRPETAQGMFTNYKNILDSFYPDLPFGIAQVGKAFRNEISPRDFIFRTREFEIMEFEYFLKETDWEAKFEKWRADMRAWFKHLGLAEDKIKEEEVPENDRAHYSKRTVDFLYDFPSQGFDEIGGLAYRTDFDLKNHQQHSGKNMEYRPKDGGDPFIPHVIEPTFGVDRNFLAVLSQAYTVDEQGGEPRVFLQLPPHLAPVKVAVSPLAKNKPELVSKAREVYKMLQKEIDGQVMWIDTGNVGKNYRRADEIGVPHFVTVDFDTLEDDTVTVRNRDTTEQERININELVGRIGRS